MSSDQKTEKVQSTQEDKIGSNWAQRVFNFLRHPITLLVLTALLSGYLIPNIARVWQDHQKELDLKSSLTTQMTESVATLFRELEAIQLDELPHLNDSTHASDLYNQFIGIITQWDITASGVRSELELYFPLPTNQLSQQWYEFSSATFSLYRLFFVKDDQNRNLSVIHIQGYLSNNKEDTCPNIFFPDTHKFMKQCVNWDKLRTNYTPVPNGNGLLKPSTGDLAVVESGMNDILHKLVQEVILSSISNYNHNIFLP